MAAETLLGTAIIFLPFNALPYFRDTFGELAYEGAFYPLAILLIFAIVRAVFQKKIYIPKHLSLIYFIIFILWIGLSGALNADSIFTSFTKGRSGVEKFALQYTLLLFCFCISVAIFQLVKSKECIFLKFRKYMCISLSLVGLYSVFEIAAINGSENAISLLSFAKDFIKDGGYEIVSGGRLSSVSGEPSYFAAYLCVTLPWLFSRLIDSKNKIQLVLYFFFTAYVVTLIYLTISRFAYMMLLVEIIIIAINYRYIKIPPIIYFVIFSLTISFIFFRNNIGEVMYSLIDDTNLSNIGRYGSQISAFNMGIDNLTIGVGFGQYGFRMAEYVPEWALTSNEILDWINPSPNTPWAPALGLFARIFGELGVPGFILWLLIWVSVLVSCIKKFNSNSHKSKKIDSIGMALVVSIIGVLLEGFNSDSFRYFGYWMLLPMCWIYLENSNSEPINIKN